MNGRSDNSKSRVMFTTENGQNIDETLYIANELVFKREKALKSFK